MIPMTGRLPCARHHGELPGRTQRGVLSGWGEPTDGHVFDHTLLEWGQGVLLACGINTESQAVWSTTSRV